MNLGRGGWGSIEADEWIDFEVCKVKIDVDRVHADKEVCQNLLLLGADVLEEGRLNLLSRREIRTDGDEELERFCVDITDIYTAFVGEEDVVSFTNRVDADVVFGMAWVG